MGCTISFGFDNVTGSNILINSRNKKILLDYGMYQGPKDESYLKNQKIYESKFIPDHLIVSHAHIDHSGNIPILTSNGYNGKIFATPQTYELCKHMLKDSAKVAAKEMPIISRQLRNKGIKTKVFPLYTEEDVNYCFLKNWKLTEYNTPTKIEDNVEFTFFDSCHILGSASIQINVKDKTKHRIYYTADLGHDSSMICNEPVVPQGIDYLICESTYGLRKRDINYDVEQNLINYVTDAFKRGGRVLIPAFSVGRMQNMILVLHKLHVLGLIPNIPIYVDSPLSIKVTELYDRYRDTINDEFMEFFKSRNLEPFNSPCLNYLEPLDDILQKSNHPCVILSSSGMADGGKVRTHIPTILEDKNSTICFVGYNAPSTTGYLIENHQGKVSIDGISIRVKCKIEKIENLSAHADQTYLRKYINKANELNYLKTVFLIHGDKEAKLTLKKLLEQDGVKNIIIPELGEIYNL